MAHMKLLGRYKYWRAYLLSAKGEIIPVQPYFQKEKCDHPYFSVPKTGFYAMFVVDPTGRKNPILWNGNLWNQLVYFDEVRVDYRSYLS